MENEKQAFRLKFQEENFIFFYKYKRGKVGQSKNMKCLSFQEKKIKK